MKKKSGKPSPKKKEEKHEKSMMRDGKAMGRKAPCK